MREDNLWSNRLGNRLGKPHRIHNKCNEQASHLRLPLDSVSNRVLDGRKRNGSSSCSGSLFVQFSLDDASRTVARYSMCGIETEALGKRIIGFSEPK